MVCCWAGRPRTWLFIDLWGKLANVVASQEWVSEWLSDIVPVSRSHVSPFGSSLETGKGFSNADPISRDLGDDLAQGRIVDWPGATFSFRAALSMIGRLMVYTTVILVVCRGVELIRWKLLGRNMICSNSDDRYDRCIWNCDVVFL